MNYTANKDTIKNKTKVFDIEISEIDSPKYCIDANLNYSDSSYFRGNLLQAFRDLLNTEYAYMKVSGIVPKKYVQYHIYLNYKDKVKHIKHFRGTNPYRETILATLQSYYQCKISHVKELTDLYVIYKGDSSKLKPGNPYIDDGSIYNNTNLSNEFMGISYLLTNYTEQIITFDKSAIDDRKYQLFIDNSEENTIEGLEKGLSKNGLRLVKEKRMFEVYKIDFDNSRY